MCLIPFFNVKTEGTISHGNNRSANISIPRVARVFNKVASGKAVIFLRKNSTKV